MNPAHGSTEALAARVLRMGVVLATALVLLGMTLTFLRHPEYRSSTVVLGELLASATERDPLVLLGWLPQGRGQAFVLLGLIVLVLTPFARVVVSGVHFARSGSLRLALCAGGVAAVILLSFVLGRVSE